MQCLKYAYSVPVKQEVAQSYNKNDVFNNKELHEVINLYVDVTIDCGEIVFDWRTNLSKYSKFPGISSLHDFVFVKHLVSGTVVSKVRTFCHFGAFEKSTINLDWS